jgi:triosephosphate isomerase
MNLTRQGCIALAQSVAEQTVRDGGVDVAVCPPSLYLDPVLQAIGNSPVGVGAQNVYHEKSGAFTGEISAVMVEDLGCRYVILGHSERRNLLGESDADVNSKLKSVLATKLTPIVCVGELLEQRQAGKTLAVIAEQFEGSFAGCSADEMSRCVIAYEPVWAIGTGQVATPDQAEEVHAMIRRLLTERSGSVVAESIRIQYGGSVKPDNALELMSQPNIDGALVGGASLKADSFLAIVRAAAEALAG